MTTEIKKEFFNAFGIEPKMLCDCEFKNLYDYRIGYGQDVCIHTEDDVKEPCKTCELAKQIHPLYPEITDRILLKLICCVPKTVLNNCTTIKEIEEAVLKDLILCVRKYTAQELKQQIQQLFKGEE